ncbi:NitT/TauT family transport system ATP-binding protein [Thermolongibacillus altinsuensis]|uniref:NitT/TauT family transport system ATP-binding protein n=1 Tax=Thermolongibacillus altinsuensis TaxID=575256 RepID=A0A4R1QDQ0_9BACL|nr:ABC transporter ATP-binding protein [Thermolongibacillus altinsuensis]TCL46545.1 NitT/TauT family transport system ATP-binding protein [Thermolongibacillus altinsuensis]GMB09873.1 ABC transporter ATP-binding protein [Thermolongibacillus altinsuensis]
MNVLAVEQISHTYFTKQAAVTALEHVSLTIEKGEFISFLGPSGCGKTTLLSIIAGLIQPTRGRILVEGKEMNTKQKVIGYMLQQDYLFPWKTIEENVTIGLNIMGINDYAKKEKALALLTEMGLSGVEKQYPYQLSGGMRQRAALVRTLATDPKILLLDEPFSALDYQTKLKLEDLVWKTLKQYNKTALLVTHDIGEAIAMSDRIFIFSAKPGRIVRTINVPETLRTHPPFAARQHVDFSSLFQVIWKELENIEQA